MMSFILQEAGDEHLYASFPHLAWMAQRVSVFQSGGRGPRPPTTAETKGNESSDGEGDGSRVGVDKELIAMSEAAKARLPRTI